MNDAHDALLDGLDARRARNLEWVQIDVAASVAATDLAAALAPLWPTFGARRWWFVRKAPGMRVRVEAGDGTEHDALRVSACAALGSFGPLQAAVYEPEIYRFGGASGMDVAHDHFALDTALAALAGRSGATVTPAQWSTAALGDLSTRVVDDPAERWDAWKQLEELLASLGAGAGAVHALGMDGVDIPLRLATAMQQGNERVAARLRETPLGHGVGRRSWFAAVAVFHWNRLGFGPPDMAQVVACVLEQLGDPR